MTDVNVENTSHHSPNDGGGESIWELAQRKRSLVLILGAATLLLISLIAFWTAMRGDFIWDDDHYVTENPKLRSFEGLKNIWAPENLRYEQTQYYPLANTAFWIQFRLWKLDPLGYHVVNVVLHAIGAALLWILLKRLEVRGAWAAAAVWAIHPVQVESVGWVTELKNVLSGIFYFASMLVYLRYTELTPAPILKPKPAVQKNDSRSLLYREWFSLPDDPTRVYALAIFLFACALLSKSVTASMPAAVLLMVWWKHGRISMKDHVVPLLPFFAIGIGMGAVTGWWEAEQIGAKGAAWDYAPTLIGEIGARCIIAGRAVWFYLGKLFVPYPLIFNYPRWNVNAASVWQYIFPVALVALLLALWALRRLIGRGPLVAMLFFVGTLFPALGFVNVYPMQYSFVADHFQYLACIGVIVLTIAVLSRVVDIMVKLDLLNTAAAPAIVFMLLGALAISTSRQGMIYRDLKSLWEDTIRRTGGANTTSWFASNNYGVWILRNRPLPAALDPAERWFKHTLKLKPDHPQAWFNMGLIAERRGELETALEHYRKCQRFDPKYGPNRINLAELLVRLDRRPEAIAEYRSLIEDLPDEVPPRVNYGLLLYRQGRVNEAIQQYQEVLRLEPSSIRGHLLMGDALAASGQDLLALQEYSQVQQLDDGNALARVGVGNILAGRGRFDDAARAFELAAKLDPRNPQPIFNLGKVYMIQQKYEDAIARFNHVLKMDPQYPKAQQNLDEALDLLAHPEKRPPPATTQTATQPTTQVGPQRP